MTKGLIATMISLFLIMVLIVCLFVGGGVIISQLFGIAGWIASLIAGGSFFTLGAFAWYLYLVEEKDYK